MSDRDLQVAGFRVFPEHKWRDGILYFVNGMLRDKPEVTDRPKIHFGDLALRLDRGAKSYHAYGVCADGPPYDDRRFGKEEWLSVVCDQVEVEHALLRFVMNNKIKMLSISMKTTDRSIDDPAVFIWKQKDRGTYRIFARGIPRTCEGLGPA